MQFKFFVNLFKFGSVFIWNIDLVILNLEQQNYESKQNSRVRDDDDDIESLHIRIDPMKI